MRYHDADHMHSRLTKSLRSEGTRRPVLEAIISTLGFFLWIGAFFKCLILLADKSQPVSPSTLFSYFTVTLIVALVSWLLSWALFLAPGARKWFSWTILFSLIALAFLRHS